MDLMKNFNDAKQALYDHVGFVEDWVVCPIDDCTDKYWNVEESNRLVRYADSEEELESQEGEYFEDDLYTQRFYDKWVYRGKKLTMVFCNPHVDGMQWFRIFDNTKER